MTTKANSTVSLKTSQGDVRAFIGKLIIIPSENKPTKVGDFCNHGNNGYVIITEQIFNDKKHWEFAQKFYTIAEPVIISETDKIEVGDKGLYVVNGEIRTCISDEEFEKDNSDYAERTNNKWFTKSAAISFHKKIIALPENLSSKHLQAIVDNKMKDADEVYVQCKRVGYQHMSADFVELDSNNYVTLHKVEKKIYTEEQVKELCEKAWNNGITSNDRWKDDQDYLTFEDWSEQNIK